VALGLVVALGAAVWEVVSEELVGEWVEVWGR
jgi:hypothetical protein